MIKAVAHRAGHSHTPGAAVGSQDNWPRCLAGLVLLPRLSHVAGEGLTILASHASFVYLVEDHDALPAPEPLGRDGLHGTAQQRCHRFAIL